MNLLAIDPGKITGISTWQGSERTALTRTGVGVIPGGIDGFLEWELDWGEENDNFLADYYDVVVIEGYRMDNRVQADRDGNALQIIGAVKAMFNDKRAGQLVIQPNTMKKLVGDDFLKAWNFWVTGGDVGWEDGRDCNDSMLHALAWAKQYHLPSQILYWHGNE